MRLIASVLSSLAASAAFAVDAIDVENLLSRADDVKTASPVEFSEILARVAARSSDLTPDQRRYLRYLQGWQSGYRGEYEAAAAALKPITEQREDPTLAFRASATSVNLAALATRYDDAFTRLGTLIELLPKINDSAARQQGLAVIAFLYNQVGEYELGLDYAQKLIEENESGKGRCIGSQLLLEALSRSGRLKPTSPEFDAGVAACVQAGELTYANLVRSYAAKLHIDLGQFESAARLLKERLPEVEHARYARLTSEYYALLAMTYREMGDSGAVREFALEAIEEGAKNRYTEPLVTAYRLLYVLAKEQGNTRDALAYHEKYAAADKGYLDDVTARQLAYQRVSHAAIADKLRIDTLNKENQVLQLERALDRKAFETRGLYIALLLLVVVTITFWAYRTKRLQLHFMRLSQLDGLTGIANRPRFIELAGSVLENAQKAEQDVCVVLCDLDHFKSINDQHGHAAGDFVLRQTVAACQTHLRASDVFGRFGGEEFGVVLPGCSMEDARLRAEQLRLAIAAISGAYEGAEIKVSGSFGVSCSATSGYELRQLLARADAALYRAKHAGRNCVAADEGGRITDPIEPPAGARYGFGAGSADVMARIARSD